MMADEDASLTDHLQALLDNPKEISLRKEYKSSKLLHFFEFDYSDDLERARYLGNGSYGSVITGRNRVDKTVKAIKVMHTNDTDLDPKMKKNMEDEAKVFCRLDCDNIVRCDLLLHHFLSQNNVPSSIPEHSRGVQVITSYFKL